MERFICIHGHFYQPPRENPWLERIELQDSAFPYHDWNERITHECYAANGASRMMDSAGRITQIVNNYARMSFNVGPTLLSWMEAHAPSAYQAILAADRESQQMFSGHGSALAQVYNHMIMPLANRRDKDTQVQWGIADFQHRFGRPPEGMWLAETAVDLETLDIMAELGIKFTLLSPYQAKRVRPMGQKEEQEWVDATGGQIDPTRAYLQRLPSGRTMALFFYDGPISQGVAFEGLLRQGENLAHRLVGAFSEERSWPQLVHIATDGETYGHHHRYGDMALAYALHYLTSHNLARLTIYGEYLELHPPRYEVEIIENTSWSCPHGVERWRSNCGCHTGGRPEWDQQWRAPLRTALDWLRNTLIPLYEKEARRLLKSPWAARDAYIHVILNRSHDQVEQFFQQHAARSLTESEKSTALKLLELQRHAMLMYTSCGWFFDELSGIETVQVIHYAGRVIQLAKETLSPPSPRDTIEAGFVKRLAFAHSNIPEYQDGAHIYERFVKPAIVDLPKVLAHYAVSSFFESYPQQADEENPPGMEIYCYTVACRDCRIVEAGKMKLAIGQAKVTSNITHDSVELSYGVLHFGDHNLTGGVRNYDATDYEEMVQEVTEAFWRADLPEVIRLLDKHFLELTYSLRTLFRDEQRKILRRILGDSLESAEAAYRQVYENHAPLMRFLADLRIPLPRSFRTAAGFCVEPGPAAGIRARRP
jgi:alpha-amylase/alpha-mannosidase (GH57 family)